MRPTSSTGVLCISIDLEPSPGRLRFTSAAAIRNVRDQLLESLGRHRLPVTWAAAEPASLAVCGPWMQFSRGDEAALWVGGDEASDQQPAHQLARRLLAARAAGTPLTSVVIQGTATEPLIELALRHGCSALRADSIANQASPRSGSPYANCQLVRYGLWHLPATARFPGRGWLRWSSTAQIGRRLRQGEFVHLAVSVAELATQGTSVPKGLHRLLAKLALWRQQGRVDVKTMQQMSDCLSTRNQAPKARSILTAA